MKTIGLLGGMSWESTATYYKLLNEGVKNTLGGLHSARCVLYSVDFAEVEACMSKGDWDSAANILSAAARTVQGAGAQCLLLCTNTLHKVAPQIQAALSIPFLHIAQVTADALNRDSIQKAALLGTRPTMEDDFYTAILQKNGIEVLVPEKPQRDRLHDIIFGELCLGTLSPASKAYYLEVIAALAAQGAKAAILGCTEIGLLIGQADTPTPLYDTTVLHAASAVAFSLGG